MQTHQALVYEQLHTLTDLLLEQARLLAEDDSDLPGDLQTLTCKVDYLVAQLDEVERRARAEDSGGGEAVCATLDALLALVDKLRSAPDQSLSDAQVRLLKNIALTGGDLREIIAELFGES